MKTRVTVMLLVAVAAAALAGGKELGSPVEAGGEVALSLSVAGVRSNTLRLEIAWENLPGDK